MANIEIKADKITPFGGIFPVIQAFSSIERLIDSELGRRVMASGYQYGVIVRTMMCNFLCGGDCMEDIKIRGRLNTLMVKAAKSQGLLREGRQYVLDFDHKFIGTEKYDTKFSYKGERGYMPGVAVLTDMSTGDDVIVGVKNRDGNANVKFHQDGTLERTFRRMESERHSSPSSSPCRLNGQGGQGGMCLSSIPAGLATRKSSALASDDKHLFAGLNRLTPAKWGKGTLWPVLSPQ